MLDPPYTLTTAQHLLTSHVNFKTLEAAMERIGAEWDHDSFVLAHTQMMTDLTFLHAVWSLRIIFHLERA